MKKILIVDDDRELAEILGKFLGVFGYPQPIYGGNGKEGLFALMETADIILVFTDLEMPGMGGSDFIQNCRTAKLPIKIILMSGTFSQGDDLTKLAKEYGADAILAKPFLPHRVLDALTIAEISPALFK